MNIGGNGSSTTRLLTVRQAAQRLNCSARHCYYLIDAGKLPALRIGVGKKGYRVPEEALEAFVRKRMKEFLEEVGICESCEPKESRS